MFKSFFSSLFIFFGCLLQANASIITFTDEGSYNAAVGSEIFTINFDGLTAGVSNGLFAGQVDFGSPEASNPDNVSFGSDAMTDAGSTSSVNGVGPMDGVFLSTDNVFAFGLEFLSSGSPQTIDIFGLSGLIGSSATPSGGFFGVLSSEAITNFDIINGEFSPNNNDRFFIDNFRANESVVPEPSILALMGLGIFGLGVSRRKMKK